MNYQVWEAYYPGSGFASAVEMAGMTDEQEVAVFLGTPLAEPLPVVTLTKLSRGKMPDALGTATSSRLASAALREVIERFCPDGIQYIPARLPRRRKPTYFLLNVTSHVACFDRERSRFKTFEDPPHAIHDLKKMVLKPIPRSAPALFHLAEIPSVILVRDDLRGEMEAASSSPGTFTPADQYPFGDQ